MCRKLFLVKSLILVLCVVGTAPAVEVKVDFGGAGTLDATWTEWNATGGNLTVDGVQLSLTNSNQANGPKLRTGIGDALTMESLGSDDPAAGGVYTLTITNLPAGSYDLHTYFNNPTSYGDPWPGGGAQEVWVNGTMQAGPSPASYQQTSTNALVLSVSFTSSGAGDVITIDWKNSASPSNWINGFELLSQKPPTPTIQFSSAASGDVEPVSPAVLEVVVSNAEAGQTYTVDYTAVGGTAAKDDDYTITEPGTLTFIPGDTSETISIDIIDDGLDEEDETIIVQLSNPTTTGSEVELGDPNEHTYTIRDPRLSVGFDAESGTTSEDFSPADITVSLSDTAAEIITVDYEVTGGTATGGGVDYTLEPNTLTFNPGQTTKTISITLVNDGVGEGDETIVITLLNPVNARLGIAQHTHTIVDPSTSEGVDAVDLKIDIGACGGTLGPPDYFCDPSGSSQTIKDGWIDWSAWDPDLPGGEACVDWYERKTKTVGDITMVLERFGPCEDEGDYGAGLRFKNTWAGPLTGDGVAVNNMPNEDDTNPCGGAPELKLTITGIPEVSSYNYQMTSWHNNTFGGACTVGGVTITVNGSQVVSNLAQTTEKADDDAATKATYEVPGGTLEFHFIASKHNVFINGFRITDGAGASDPIPADGSQDVDPGVTLWWTPGQYAQSHNVYLGTSEAAVAAANMFSPEFERRVTVNSYKPAVPLELDRTYYWRIDEVNPGYPESPWRSKVWSFTIAGPKARNPNPANGESSVHPIPTLSWTPSPPATSHDVYLGTDENAVANALPASPEFEDNVEPNLFEPGLLTFGWTYYWRIDEVNDTDTNSPWTGDVWHFTVHDGNASNPDPPHGSNTVTDYVVLSWTPAPLTDSHDIYFGTTEAAVANATPGSNEYKGNQTSTSFDPRPLTEGLAYYWRVDEVGTAVRKGNLWNFTAVPPVNMQVDFVPEAWDNPTQAIPGTDKSGWIPFMPGGWGDLYMHDFRGIRNLGGTGLDVCVTGCTEGRSGMKVYGMCMDNKAGGAAPNGSPVGEPIANSWFTSVDRCAGPLGAEGSSQLGICNLPAGTYEVKMYHNLWEPSSDDSRECTNDAYGDRSPMDVHVRSLAQQWAWRDMLCAVSLSRCGPAGDALNKITGFAGPDPGNNVVAIQEAFGVLPTSVQTDADVATSLVKFWTDGSPVILHCQTGDQQDSQYRGDRAAINAFEIRSIAAVEQPPACWDQTQCHGDADGTGDVKGSDFLALKNSWYKVYGVDVEYDPCADFDRNGEVKGSDFLILKNNWYQTVDPNCAQGGAWPP
jgi:hypothetical protein